MMDVTWFQYTCIVGVVGWAVGFLTCLALNGLSISRRKRCLVGAIFLGIVAAKLFSLSGSDSIRDAVPETAFKVEAGSPVVWHCSSCLVWKNPVLDAYGTPLCCPRCEECGAKMELIEQETQDDDDT